MPVVIVCLLGLTLLGLFLKTKTERERQQQRLDELRRGYAVLQRAVRHTGKLYDEGSVPNDDDIEQPAFQKTTLAKPFFFQNFFFLALKYAKLPF